MECEFDSDCSGPKNCNLVTNQCEKVACSDHSDCDGYGDGNNHCGEILGNSECWDCSDKSENDPLTGISPKCNDPDFPTCFLASCWECQNIYSRDVNGNLDKNGDNPTCVSLGKVSFAGMPMNRCSNFRSCAL